jgi:hypothetical protein
MKREGDGSVRNDQEKLEQKSKRAKREMSDTTRGGTKEQRLTPNKGSRQQRLQSEQRNERAATDNK